MTMQSSLFDDEAPPAQVQLPRIWPVFPVPTGEAATSTDRPGDLFDKADLINGLLVDVADGTLSWLRRTIRAGRKRLLLVVVVVPAGPTREEHLAEMLALQEETCGGAATLQTRVLPARRWIEGDVELSTIPPTVLQGVEGSSGRTVWSVGSVGDCGCMPVVTGSANFIFEPGEVLRNTWRDWFQNVWNSSAPLTRETARVPAFRRPKGEPGLRDLWVEYEEACRPAPMGNESEAPEAPGEDAAAGDTKPPTGPWDDGVTALDGLAEKMHRVYANGGLVTVAEGSRIKPLKIPVKAALLDQASERVVGAVLQKQSFSLRILDEKVEKAIEKCRLVNDVIEVLALPLSQGNRWLPNTARALLDGELQARNERGRKTLEAALGSSVEKYVDGIANSVRKDLDAMYRTLVGEGRTVPEAKAKVVLDEVRARLSAALKGPIAPTTIHNRLLPPYLGKEAPDENWMQPLSLLSHSAQLLRTALTDPFFARRLWGLSFDLEQMLKACDPFSDAIVDCQDTRRAKEELGRIEAIGRSNMSWRAKCEALLEVVEGR